MSEEEEKQYFPDWYVDETVRRSRSNIRIIGRVSDETLERMTY